MILDTVPVLREEDRQDLLQVRSTSAAARARCPSLALLKDFSVIVSQVMPSYLSHGWKVKKPFSELLPDVDSQGDDDDDGAEA